MNKKQLKEIRAKANTLPKVYVSTTTTLFGHLLTPSQREKLNAPYSPNRKYIITTMKPVNHYRKLKSIWGDAQKMLEYEHYVQRQAELNKAELAKKEEADRRPPDPVWKRSWKQDAIHLLKTCGSCGNDFYGGHFRQMCKSCQDLLI